MGLLQVVSPRPAITLTQANPALYYSTVNDTAEITYSGTANGANIYSITFSSTLANISSKALSGSPIRIPVPGSTAIGTYTGNLWVENTTTTCRSLDYAVSVIINPTATAIIGGNATICKGQSSNLTIVLTGTSPWVVSYTDGTTTTPVSPDPIGVSPFTILVPVSPVANKTYTIGSVSDFNGSGTGSGSAAITVLPTPVSGVLYRLLNQ